MTTTYTINLPDSIADLSAPAAVDLLASIDSHLAEVMAARIRLAAITTAAEQVAHINKQFLASRDGDIPAVTPGGDLSAWPIWRQPLGAGLGVYSLGDVRQHAGKLWRSDRAVNVWEPGTSDAGWTDITAELDQQTPPDPQPTAPAWSATATYKPGDLVERDGTVYRCLVAHGAEYAGTWGPPATGVWELVQ